MSPDRVFMSRFQYPENSADAFRWSQLRLDASCFETLTECIEACLPEMRRGAQLFSGTIEKGDRLTEDFLIEILSGPQPGDTWRSPAGLTETFEKFVTGRFRPRRRLRATNPNSEHDFGSADDFLAGWATG